MLGPAMQALMNTLPPVAQYPLTETETSTCVERIAQALAGPSGVTFDWNINDGLASRVYVHGDDGQTITGLYTATNNGSMRGVVSHGAGSGKFYFEFLVGTVSSWSPAIGVGTAAASISTFVGNDANGWGMLMDARSFTGGAQTAQNAYAAGDIVGVAVDFTAATGSVKFFKNNVAQTTAYINLTLGTLFPMGSMIGDANNPKGRLRLRAANQTYAPPAGYVPWI